MKRIYIKPSSRFVNLGAYELVCMSIDIDDTNNVDDSDKSKERNPFSFGDENDFGFGE